MPHKDPIRRKQYRKEYHESWYARNKEHRIKQVARRKKDIREWFRALKETLHCEVCEISGEGQAWVLEFHHLNPEDKKELISYMVSAGYSKKRIMNEVEKCMVICANCHRSHHYKEHIHSLQEGEPESVWTRAGRVGAIGHTLFEGETRTKQRRGRRKKQRQDRDKRMNRADAAGEELRGPAHEVDSELDVLLRKVELDQPLSPADKDTLRRLATNDHKWTVKGAHRAEIPDGENKQWTAESDSNPESAD